MKSKQLIVALFATILLAFACMETEASPVPMALPLPDPIQIGAAGARVPLRGKIYPRSNIKKSNQGSRTEVKKKQH
ncbi:hypothetical protein KM043_002587 [Ampulex compressa]|nr:hypothetical protein KM043_002587 [Ampulex compressa]